MDRKLLEIIGEMAINLRRYAEDEGVVWGEDNDGVGLKNLEDALFDKLNQLGEGEYVDDLRKLLDCQYTDKEELEKELNKKLGFSYTIN